MKTLAIMPNLGKPRAASLTAELVKWFNERRIEVLVEEAAARAIGHREWGCPLSELPHRAEVVISIGGDGTLLNVARKLADADIPLLGINLGRLGFLTEIELENLYDDLPALLDGEYQIEERLMLSASVIRRDEEIGQFVALNDICVTKGPFARIIFLKTFVGDAYLDTYPGDGLIIATPTGSTGYSLSAGGPIVNPNIKSLIITPICPHTLHSRSIVISEDETVSIHVDATHSEIMLTLDGQKGVSLLPRDRVVVKRAPYSTRLIRLKRRDFYEILRRKLRSTSYQPDGLCRSRDGECGE